MFSAALGQKEPRGQASFTTKLKQNKKVLDHRSISCLLSNQLRRLKLCGLRKFGIQSRISLYVYFWLYINKIFFWTKNIINCNIHEFYFTLLNKQTDTLALNVIDTIEFWTMRQDNYAWTIPALSNKKQELLKTHPRCK